MRVLRSDAGKLVLYIISCFLLAALTCPWAYNAGTLLGELTEKHSYNWLIDSLGEYARNASFADYFKRSLLGSALLLLLPLLFSMRLRVEPAPLHDSPWSAYLPPREVSPPYGQPLRRSRWGPFQLVGGCVLAAGLLLGMGWLLLSMGWFSLKDPAPWDRAWKQAIAPSIAASFLEETVFRGVLLGIFLRTFRPCLAIILISMIFASLHFLQPPDDIAVFVQGQTAPPGAVSIEPGSTLSGFQLLHAITLRFQNLEIVLFEFLSLFAVGLTLAYARLATASLWLPIGLHMGWIFAYTSFSHIATRAQDLDASVHYLIGSNLKEGLVPLFTFGVTALLVVLFVRIFPKPGRHPQKTPLAPEA